MALPKPLYILSKKNYMSTIKLVVFNIFLMYTIFY